MKDKLKYLWFRATTMDGDLVIAKTVPIVIGATVLEHSIDVIGTYTTINVNPNNCCIKGPNGDIYKVYTRTVKKISTIKNPEYFI